MQEKLEDIPCNSKSNRIGWMGIWMSLYLNCFIGVHKEEPSLNFCVMSALLSYWLKLLLVFTH